MTGGGTERWRLKVTSRELGGVMIGIAHYITMPGNYDLVRGANIPFSITKHYNIEILFFSIAQSTGKSLGLCHQDFPWAQAICHCISILLSQYRYSISVYQVWNIEIKLYRIT